VLISKAETAPFYLFFKTNLSSDLSNVHVIICIVCIYVNYVLVKICFTLYHCICFLFLLYLPFLVNKDFHFWTRVPIIITTNVVLVLGVLVIGF